MSLTEITVLMSEDQLLACIWYSDGSGASSSGWEGMPVTDCPGDWRIASIALSDELIELKLENRA